MCSKENNFKKFMDARLCSAAIIHNNILRSFFFIVPHLLLWKRHRENDDEVVNKCKQTCKALVYIHYKFIRPSFFFCVHTQAHLLWLLCFHFNRPFLFSYNIAKKKKMSENYPFWRRVSFNERHVERMRAAKRWNYDIKIFKVE